MTTASAPAPRHWPAWICGTALTEGQQGTVTHPGDQSLVGTFTIPDSAAIEAAVAGAWAVRKEAQATTAAQRAEALMHVSRRLAERAEEVAGLITAENGKPISLARVEAGRAVAVFRLAAEEARRFNGEFQRLDTEAAAAGRAAINRRFAHGPVLGISPFNFPVNLVAHKIAPALAVGAPIVVKPAPATPLGALLLGELLAETDLPAGMFSVLPVGNDVAPVLVADPRLPVVSFTGSDVVGFGIQAAVPSKHVVLELGGNAAAIVLDDYNSEDDIAWAAKRIATFGNSQAGQTCVAVQRILVHEDIAERFTAALIEQMESLTDSSPWDDSTVVGPMIHEAAAIRVQEWIDEAIAAGATPLVSGPREGTFVRPTLLTDVPAHVRVETEEVFGPVMSIRTISSFRQAIDIVNDSKFGLQTGVFTHNIQQAFLAQRELEVGGVIIGDAPTYRADAMPYGGIKASGVGREGVRSAMMDLTHERTLVLTDLAL